MHTIKRKARRVAWVGTDKDDDNPLLRYMPYAGRHRRISSNLSRHEARDVEKALYAGPNGITSPRSGAQAGETAVEGGPRGPNQIEEDTTRAGPPRSATLPSTIDEKSAGPFPGSPNQSDIPSDATPASSGDSLQKRSPTAPEPVARRDDGLRQRLRAPFIHNTKHDGTDQTHAEDDGGSCKEKPKLTVRSQLWAVFGSWVNLLLICVPVGIVLWQIDADGRAVFVINFLGIIPLAGILSYATEELAIRVGETIGGLLNASFGNAVELIVSIIALVKNEILVVQTSLIGSMLSNLLLVMGMCFFAGGVNRVEQNFNITVANTACSLLMIAVGALIIPTAFQNWSDAPDNQTIANIPALSQGVSIMLLFVYGCYLFFQLHTHRDIYNAPSEKAPKKSGKVEEGAVNAAFGHIGQAAAVQAGEAHEGVNKEENDADDGEEDPKLTVWAAVITLCASTALVGVLSEAMVDAIPSIADSVSPEFIGVILLPIVGNAAEHVTALTVAIKDKMDLAIGVAIGSSLQIALLVLPLTVILGWIIDTDPDMTLNFDLFLIWVLFVAILLVNYLIADGKSHWLEGILLMVTYVIIAVACWFYPQSEAAIGA